MHQFVMFSVTLFLMHYYIYIVILHRINYGFNLLYNNILIIVQFYFNLILIYFQYLRFYIKIYTNCAFFFL